MEVKNRADNIEMVDTSILIHHPKNMHVHSDEQIVRLCKLIEYQGFRNPLIVQKGTQLVVAGNGRLMAARSMGLKQVPVIYQEFESEEQVYSYIVSDNAIGKDQWASLDLGKINQDFLDLGPDLDIEMLGIKDFVIEPIEKFEPHADEDSVPEVKHDPVTKRGDVWLLGDHRVMCGDSTMIDDVEKLMNGDRAQISFTSPPYNAGDEVEIDSKGHKYESHNDSMSGDDYLDLLCQFTSNTLIFSDMSIVNIQQLAGNKITFIDYLEKFKNNLVDVGIWNKTHGTPQLPKRVMNCAWEYILFFSSENNPPRTIKTAPMFQGNVNNIYDGAKQTKNEFSKIHRATFPAHLPEYYISTFSEGAVLDLFNGTGTTLIACQKLGRKYFGMEIDPLYVDVTIKRWEEYTGKKAVLENGNIQNQQEEQVQ